ncbi:MAG: hypothetical protein L7F78_12605 [Syntrophales bacterium LBB04]|nr:hypothetical protein [Syntrophales bacterium LBB04]
MNQKTSDQGWQQLQDHIEGFVGRALSDSLQRIEYKPLFITPLLEMPSERYQNKLQGTTAMSDDFSPKGK